MGWATLFRRSSRGRRLLLAASAFNGGGSFQPGVNEPDDEHNKRGHVKTEIHLYWATVLLYGCLPGKAPGGAMFCPAGGGGCWLGIAPTVGGGGGGGVMFSVDKIKELLSAVLIKPCCQLNRQFKMLY